MSTIDFENEYYNRISYLDEIKDNEIVNEIINLKKQLELQRYDIYYLNNQIEELKKKLIDYNYLFKSVAKDYPELVIAKPEFFISSEKKEN